MWINAVNRIVVLRILTTGHVADDVSRTWGKHGNDAVLCQYSLRLNLERIFHNCLLGKRLGCHGSMVFDDCFFVNSLNRKFSRQVNRHDNENLAKNAVTHLEASLGKDQDYAATAVRLIKLISRVV